jgi:methylglutaconyl-CoA hydratase
MQYETLTLDVDARGVAALVLNRPEKHNVLSARMIVELTEVAGRLSRDPAVRVVVLSGAGASFCAGGDLGWMQDQIRADRAKRAAEATRLAMMLKALDEMARPLIARVHGNAFGGGVGILSVCDVAIGVEDARFGLTETRLGLIPATIGPYVSARLGPHARRFFFSSRLFSAAEAHHVGLLSAVVPAAELDAAIEAEVRPYLGGAPGAVAQGKALLRRLAGGVGEALIAETIETLVERWETDEARDGIAAFFDKTDPPWKG